MHESINDGAYDMILQGQYVRLLASLSPNADSGTKNDSANHCYRALALVLSGNADAAKKEISFVRGEGLDPASRSACLEAEMLLMRNGPVNRNSVLLVALAATEHYRNAVFANRVLARMAEGRGEFEDALSHYSRALERYPGSERTLLDMVRVLTTLKRQGEATELIRRAQPSLRRELYRLSLLMRGGYRWVLGLAGAILLIHPLTGPPTSVLLGAVGIICAIGALSWRDGVILGTSLRLILGTILLSGLRHLLIRNA